MPFIYHIMGEYLRQELDNKQKEIIEEQKRRDFFMKRDIESIKNALIIAFYNGKTDFKCKRHCSEEYIENIKKSLEILFSDSTIYYSYNNQDNSYMLHIEWD